MRFILAIFLFVFSTSALGAVTCKDYFTEQPNFPAREDYIFHWDRELVAQRFVSLLRSWNQVLGPLGIPHVKLELANLPVELSEYRANDSHLLLGVLVGDRTPLARDVVYAHEFAHGVFWNHFKLRIGDSVTTLREFSRLVSAHIEKRGIGPALDKLRLEIHRTLEAIGRASKYGTFDDIRELETILKAQRKKLSDLDPEGEMFRTIDAEMRNYNELFADIFPALLWNEPRIFSELVNRTGHDPHLKVAIKAAHRQENKVDADPREFALVPFKNWKRETSDQYTSLDPVRGYLWKMYMEKIAAEDVPLFLIVYLNAVSFHIQERLARLGDKPVTIENLEMDPSAMNREFLRFFIREARHVGLPMTNGN